MHASFFVMSILRSTPNPTPLEYRCLFQISRSSRKKIEDPFAPPAGGSLCGFLSPMIARSFTWVHDELCPRTTLHQLFSEALSIITFDNLYHG